MQLSQTICQALNKASESFGLRLSGALVSALAATFLVNDSSLLDWRFNFRYLMQPASQAHSDLVMLALFTKKSARGRSDATRSPGKLGPNRLALPSGGHRARL